MVDSIIASSSVIAAAIAVGFAGIGEVIECYGGYQCFKFDVMFRTHKHTLEEGERESYDIGTYLWLYIFQSSLHILDSGEFYVYYLEK